MVYTQFDLDTLAMTVYGEARGESLDGQKAVVWVVRNRLKTPGWWSRQRGDGIPDDTIAAVCRDPSQFSCWNPTDPNRFKLADAMLSSSFEKIRKICEDTLHEDESEDITNSATHYCTKAVAGKTSWAKHRAPCAEIGNHLFFKIGL